ncbi:hypothetical protein HK102_003935 [Quaeritorhiza haematococci]|nr:hypothetical protein HK102_003935 [Quaeritorhiza haematococci]
MVRIFMNARLLLQAFLLLVGAVQTILAQTNETEIVVKIASLNSWLSSRTQPRFYNGQDINRLFLIQQAIVDRFNRENTWYPPNVRVELLYGGNENNAGKAVIETIRLVQENVSAVISSSGSAQAIAESNVISLFNLPMCALTATANELSDKTLFKTFYRVQSPSKVWGFSFAEFLAMHNLRRVAVLIEDHPICQSVMSGFTEAASKNNVSILVTRFLPYTSDRAVYMRSYRYGFDWGQYVKSARDSSARVVFHCGGWGFYNLVEEAANRGYIQRNEMLFIHGLGSDKYESFYLRETNFTHIIPYLYGTAIISNINYQPAASQYREFLSQTLATGDVALNTTQSPRTLLAYDPLIASCVYSMIPAMSTLVSRNLTTWQDIARGNILRNVTLSQYLNAANAAKMPGQSPPRPMSWDEKTGDPLIDLYITNVRNKTLMALAAKPNDTTNVMFADTIGTWYNSTFSMMQAMTFPDGTTTPPRVTNLVLDFIRNEGLFIAGFAITILLEVIFFVTLMSIHLKRNTPAVRKNSPTFLLLIVAGCFLIQGSVIPLYFGNLDSFAICRASDFLFHMGFAVTFGAILLKVYRIYRIFTNQSQASPLNLQDAVLLRYYSLALSVFLIIVLAEMFGTQLNLKASAQEIDDLTKRAWSVCVPDTIGYILLILELGMLVVGTYFAVNTRKVKEDYNEAHALGVSIYNCLFILVISVIITAAIPSITPDIVFLVHFLRSALVTVTVIAVMCLPKVLVKLPAVSNPSSPQPDKKQASSGQKSTDRKDWEAANTLASASNSSTGVSGLSNGPTVNVSSP